MKATFLSALNGHSHISYVVFRSKRVEQRNLLLDSKAKTVLINQNENIISNFPGNVILIKLENVGHDFFHCQYLCNLLNIIAFVWIQKCLPGILQSNDLENNRQFVTTRSLLRMLLVRILHLTKLGLKM